MPRKRAKKKHHGAKDPYKQIEARFEKIKHKIDRPPANEKTQEIPRRLLELAEAMKEKEPKKEEIKLSKKKKKMERLMKRKTLTKDGMPLMDTASFVSRVVELPGMTRPLSKIPRVVQMVGESDAKFYKRVFTATKEMMNESKFEDKYNVDIERNEQGAIKMKKRKELDDQSLSESKRAKLEEKEKKKKDKKKELDYKRKHKKKKEQDIDEFKNYEDKVPFGEVVYEPPSLDTSRFPKTATGETKAKSFLFMDKLKGIQVGKAPELTAAKKRSIEEERLKAVQAYRDLKSAKYREYNKSLSYG